MATITIEVPDEVSASKFEAQIGTMARNLGLQAKFSGFRKIKLITLNPNAVDQRVRRHLVGVNSLPTLRTLVDGSNVGAAARNVGEFDGPGAA